MFSFKTLIDDGQRFVLFLEIAPSDLKQVESGYNIVADGEEGGTGRNALLDLTRASATDK